MSKSRVQIIIVAKIVFAGRVWSADDGLQIIDLHWLSEPVQGMEAWTAQ